MGPFALGRSTDLGVTVDPLWTFQDSVNDVGCAACTQVGDECPAYWPDVEFDLGLSTATDALPADPDAASSCVDGALPDAGMDGGRGAPPSASCGCRAGARSPMPWLGALLVALTIAFRRRIRI
jgi:MYXO-CTERM domain-containing protein